MLYGRLLQAQWKQTVRSLSPRYRWLAVTGITFLGLYVGGILLTVGLFFSELLWTLRPDAEPVAYLNENLLIVFASLFSIRFFFQRTPRLNIRPYLHLPIARGRLVAFFQVSSLLSAHNLLPLLFFVPFWTRHIAPYYGPWSGGFLWLGGVLAALVISHYLNILLRTLLTTNARRFFIIAGALFALIVIDQLSGARLLSIGSHAIFGALLSGNSALLLQLLILAGALFLYSSVLLRDRLHHDASDGRRIRLASPVVFTSARSQAANLMLLELQLIWRNRRPRTYLFFALFFGTVYVALLLFDPRVSQNVLIAALAGLFASGIFAINHGQLMFSWESSYFDGLLARSIDARELVLAKLLTLQSSCVIFFIISLPIFLGLAPDLLPIHVTFLLYNAGITSVLMVALAVHNRKRVAVEKAGGFFNYEGFSLRHWFWFIPTALPPTLLLFFWRDYAGEALLLIGGIGALSLLLTGAWTRLFEHVLRRRKYLMAAGFRHER